MLNASHNSPYLNFMAIAVDDGVFTIISDSPFQAQNRTVLLHHPQVGYGHKICFGQ